MTVRTADLMALALADPQHALIRCLESMTESIARGDPGTAAMAGHAAAIAARECSGSASAMDLLKTTLRLAESAGPVSSKVAHAAQVSLAGVLIDNGETESGLSLLQDLASLASSAQETMHVHLQSAAALGRLGRERECAEAFRAALELSRMERDARVTSYVLNNRAIAHLDAGRLARAESDLRAAHVMLATTLDEPVSDIHLARVRHNLGLVRIRRGDLRAGLVLMDDAWGLLRGGGHSALNAQIDHCEVLSQSGRYDAVLDISRRVFWRSAPRIVRSAILLAAGHALFLSGKSEQARDLAEESSEHARHWGDLRLSVQAHALIACCTGGWPADPTTDNPFVRDAVGSAYAKRRSRRRMRSPIERAGSEVLPLGAHPALAISDAYLQNRLRRLLHRHDLGGLVREVNLSAGIAFEPAGAALGDLGAGPLAKLMTDPRVLVRIVESSGTSPIDAIWDRRGRESCCALFELDATAHGIVVRDGGTVHFDLGPATVIYAIGAKIRRLISALASGRTRAADGEIRRKLQALGTHAEEVFLPMLAVDRPNVVVTQTELAAFPWGVLPSLAGIPLLVTPSFGAWLAASDATPVRQDSLVAVAGPGLATARAEALAVASQYDGAHVLVGDDARAANLVKRFSAAGVLHLSAHGRFLPADPFRSGLELVDGRVDFDRLCRVPTWPSVVVAGCCDLGMFFASRLGSVLLRNRLPMLGATTVIASTAAVADESSPVFMTELHRQLRRGVVPSAALARAREQSADPVFGAYSCWGVL